MTDATPDVALDVAPGGGVDLVLAYRAGDDLRPLASADGGRLELYREGGR